MNEKKRKKLFGVFNIVDILLILIVLLGAVIGWKLLAGKGQAEQAAGKVYSYVVMGPEVLDETAEFPVVGGNAYNSSTSVYLGTVQDFRTEPYTETVYDEQEEAFRKVCGGLQHDLSDNRRTGYGNGTGYYRGRHNGEGRHGAEREGQGLCVQGYCCRSKGR